MDDDRLITRGDNDTLITPGQVFPWVLLPAVAALIAVLVVVFLSANSGFLR